MVWSFHIPVSQFESYLNYFVLCSKRFVKSLLSILLEFRLNFPQVFQKVGRVLVNSCKPNPSFNINDSFAPTRMEVHWLLASQDKQKQVEGDILAHLRQISIWEESPEMMTKFMHDCMTCNYLNQASDLLCLLFEELQQPLPPLLRATISSPSKSETSR